jgi:D-alanyl-D-alanine dipeptidase
MLILAGYLHPAPALAADLPPRFVRLADVAPTIRQDMRYAGSDNFLGRPAKRYEAPVCILTDAAAQALAKAQQLLEKDGLSFVVFDCYRPKSAVADFVAWTRAGGDIAAQWSPTTPRKELIAKGYIAARSAHSRGSTVDIGIVSTGPAKPFAAPSCGAATPAMLDFGSGFDCFDPVSNTAHRPLPEQATANRARLVEAMSAAGFRNYSAEWWHFTLRREPYPKRSFDFPVTAN